MRFFDKIKNSFININELSNNKKYRKYISSFSSAKGIYDDFANDLDNVLEFDLINYSGEHQIDGVLAKRFVMVDKDLISGYIEAVLGGASSYQTFMSDENIFSNEVPKNVSVLLKRQSRRGVCVEVLVSRILNFFDVDTVYNEVVKDKKESEYLVSIDFIKQDEELFIFDDIGGKFTFTSNSDLLKVKEMFLKNLNKLATNKCLIISKKEREKLLENFLYGIMVRRFLIGDNDLRSGNFGLLYNKKTRKVRVAPNFDFGGSFLKSFYPGNLKFFYNNYPYLYEKFVDKFNQFTNIKDGEPFYKNFIVENSTNMLDYFQVLNFFEKDIQQLKLVIEELEKDKKLEKF